MRATAVSLEIREASVFYGANRVLDRVSLSAAGSEFIALLGASGCGTTTLLRAICRLCRPGQGSIVVGGQDVTRLSPERRNIAMVFQSYALWPHMTVAQNIGYGLKLRHVTVWQAAHWRLAPNGPRSRRRACRRRTRHERKACPTHPPLLRISANCVGSASLLPLLSLPVVAPSWRCRLIRHSPNYLAWAYDWPGGPVWQGNLSKLAWGPGLLPHSPR